jgi:hypothetical protein
MSQQEFLSEESAFQPLESEIQAQSYYRPTRPKTGDVPKNEHPSTYEASIPTYEHGHPYEHGYRPYTPRSYTPYYAQWQVPPWARPQHNNGKGLRTAVFVVLGLLLIVPLLKVVAFLLVGIGILLSFAVFAIVLLPIILALLAVFAAFGLLILAALGIPIRSWRSPRRSFGR